jgi:hypothetical protein
VWAFLTAGQTLYEILLKVGWKRCGVKNWN